jgi:cell filamentation protein
MYDAAADDYCYPGTTVLKNKLDLRDADELADFEAEVSDARADEESPGGKLDFEHFKAIHHHLFQDVYDWAGEIRTVRMSKGGSTFCFPETIESQAKKLFAQLKKDNFLDEFEPDEFAAKAAHFLSELNVTHAFREGNGRTQLSFFLLLADQAGYPIDLEDLDPDAFLNAMIASFEGDEKPLAAVIRSLVKDRSVRND